MSLISWLKSLFVNDSSENNETVEMDTRARDFSMPRQTPTNSVPYNRIHVEENLEVPESSIKEKIGDFTDKAKDFAKETGKEVVEQGSALWTAVKDKMDDLDEGTKEFREGLKNKANETIGKINDYVDETIATGKKLDEEKQLDADHDGLADKKIDFGKTMDESNPGFFEKADQWLKDHDHNDSKPHSANEDNDVQKVEPKGERPTLDLPKD